MGWLKNLLGSGADGQGESSDVLIDNPPAPLEQLAVIGDIHGRIDLLESIVPKLEARAEQTIVFVGDYVDRGDRSAEVLSQLMGLCHAKENIVCLMGNHERMMLDFLDNPSRSGERWLRYGGLQTVASFGIKARQKPTPAELEKVAFDLRAALPEGLEGWIRQLKLSFTSGNVTVVHAAADPLLAIEEQDPKTLMWGHKDFRRVPRRDGRWIAHGHTIVDEPEAHNGVISLDTGAYATGRLTAAIIKPAADIEFISA